MFTINDSRQILLFHDLLYGRPQTALRARQCLISDYDFTADQLPRHTPGTLHDGVLRPGPERDYLFRRVPDHTYSFLDKNPHALKGMKLKPPQNQVETGPDYRAVADKTYYRKNPAIEYISQNWVPVSSLGLGITGTATEAYLKIKDYEGFKAAVKDGKFVANWNGKRIWKAGFRGNASVSAEVVAAEKVAFESGLKTMKLVKSIGRVSAGIGIVVSGYDAYKKGWTTEGNTKFALDVIMTGVAFIPVVGWVISGLYFITDAALTLSGNDWWHVVWEQFVLPTTKSIENAIDSYYKARRIMYIP